MSRIARGQTYPAKPGRIIVGNAAGGAQDLVARLMGQWLSERLGQTFVKIGKPAACGSGWLAAERPMDSLKIGTRVAWHAPLAALPIRNLR